MNADLSKCTAIVTGGAKGFGSGIAEALRRRGADVWITGRDEAALERTADALKVHAVRADVTRGEDWDRLFGEVSEAGRGRIDILVNNAGAGVRIAPVEEMSDEEIQASISVNLVGAILGCRRAAPVMRKQKSGTIINVSSVCARQAWPGWSVYSAAKAGLVQFSNCLYTELREHGVRVTSVIPSWGATGFLTAANLDALDAETRAGCIQPWDMGELVADICALPPHLQIQDVTLWPLVQEVSPL